MLTPPALPISSTKGLKKMEHNVVKIKQEEYRKREDESWTEVEPAEHITPRETSLL